MADEKVVGCPFILDEQGRDFAIWKDMMPMYLKANRDAWEIAEGRFEDVKPGTAYDDLTAAEKITRDRFDKASDAGKKILFASIHKNLIRTVFFDDASKITVKTCWERLKNGLAKTKAQRKDKAMKEFSNFRFDPRKSATENIIRFQLIRNNLRDTGTIMPADYTCEVLFKALPPKWQPFRLGWAARLEKDKTPELLMEQIKSESTYLEPQHSLEMATAMVSQMNVAGSSSKPGKHVKHPAKPGYNKKREKQSSQHASFKCWKCGQTGHTKNDCRRPSANSTKAYRKPGKFHPKANCAEALLVRSVEKNHANDVEFLLDSGATHTIVSSKKWFTSFTKDSDTAEVRLGSSHRLRVSGQGTIELIVRMKDRMIKLTIEDVLLVPSIRKNLISIGKLAQDGYKITFLGNNLCLEKDGFSMQVNKDNDLYRLNVEDRHFLTPLASGEATAVPLQSVGAKDRSKGKNDAVSLKGMHEVLAHINKKSVQRFLELQKIPFEDDLDKCEHCILAKQTRVSDHSRPKESKASKPGTVVADLCSPSIKSIGNHRHFLLITDEFSKFRKVFFLRTKDEAVKYISHYLKWFRNSMGYDVKRFHSDSGSEFKNQKLARLLNDIGAEQTFSSHYRPAQNGQSERGIRTIENLVRAVLISSGLESKKYLWAECVNYCTEVLNITMVNEDTQSTPYEIFYKKKIQLTKLHAFGTKCFVHVQKKKLSKFEKRSLPAILVGYANHALGFRVFIPKTKTIVQSKDVTFLRKPVKAAKAETPTDAENDISETQEESDASSVENDESEETEADQSPFSAEAYIQQKCRSPFSESDDEDIGNPPGQRDPSSYSEAMRSPDKKFWQAAIDDELESMKSMNAWRIADLPKGKRALDSRWIFRLKVDPMQKTQRYKARLCLRGFRQIEGVDFSADKIFSPVARHEAVRTILSIAAEEGLYLHQFDVKTAFLHAELTDEIYMKPPEGSNYDRNKVLRLLRSIYGLKQSPYNFNKKLTKIIKDRGLIQSHTDPCLFYRNGKERLMILIYVDDAICAGATKGLVLKFIESLRKDLELTSKPLSYFLGMQIEMNQAGDVHLHQTKYVEQVLARFNMTDCKPASTPCDASIYSIKSEDRCDQQKYRALIGSIMYLATGSRIDIAFITAYLCRYLDKCTPEHLAIGMRVLRYLKLNPSLGITYKRNSTEKTLVFSDADHASDPEDRKSTTGSLIMRQSGPVIWHSTKQSNISISSCESEFYGAAETMKAAMWMTKLLTELGIQEKLTIQMDNQSAIAIIKQPQHYRRTKHIEIRYMFVKQGYAEGKFELTYVETLKQRADWLTKPLNRSIFLKQRELSGLESWKDKENNQVV